ncbi:protein of unknown function DUF1549 [Planctopirus limnophila DSM 3776]|uniref:Cytochrome c domain-containing protein n=1 Tax=Planctopirus limnophila (strain ATCC 43296 / DSM 3776 / IFAM 1008 / Mu 290) TaxID=521674 RepID=D5SYJ2_PLAL2|nr:PSD1 and planctomycete cytochrome C domain-containing protein [Planctopirus limnophila]ADG67720.1 protein of unknown function DUF1549 [Planctopirus limnophila DSM 3776]
MSFFTKCLTVLAVGMAASGEHLQAQVKTPATAEESRQVVSAQNSLNTRSVVVSGSLQDSQLPADFEFFEKKVRPILVAHCYTCHSADNKAAGGLRVDDYQGLRNGGNRGSAVVPHQPEESLLVQAVRYTGKLKMPPEEKLPDEKIQILEDWIRRGAPWPRVEVSHEIGKGSSDYQELLASHWAWQPLKAVTPPVIQDSNWATDPIDQFVLAKLNDHNLSPVSDADPASLLRRVAFDLTGLPPGDEQLRAFEANPSTENYAQLVDGFLASPAFGEKWGRHWLDVSRFGESTGSARNIPYPQAYKYRNYVIDAFNKDKPFDRFIAEQVAGDLLPYSSESERIENLVATGFLALGVKDVNQRFKVRFVMDNVDEAIDTVTRSVLGVTVSCARCHDHKFDPVSQREYYALAGIFTSTDILAGVRNKMGGGGLDYYDTAALLVISQTKSEPDPEQHQKVEKAQQAVAEAREEFERLRGTPEGQEKGPNGRPRQQMARQKWNRLQAELNLLTDPAHLGEVTLGARDSKQISDTELRLRGEAEQLGPVVPRGFLKLATWEGQPQITAGQSGRAELAQWLTAPQNAITHRVIVNRVWHHLFGRGIVSTVDNFGLTGDTPSHPELLDFLAQDFIQNGASLKKLIRKIVLTKTYRLSTENVAAYQQIDPANRWIWRHTPRRLTAEEIRDSILATTQSLDTSRPERSPAAELKVIEIRNNGPEARNLQVAAENSTLRSVYLPLVRGILPRALEVFDFAEQGMVTGARDQTTVATQSLYLLNDPFVRQHSVRLAQSLLDGEDHDDRSRIVHAYRQILGRDPSVTEVNTIVDYLSVYEKEASIYLASNTAGSSESLSTNRLIAAASSKPEETSAASGNNPSGATNSALALANADEMEQNDLPVALKKISIRDSRTAAWGSFIQALYASGDFRYLK